MENLTDKKGREGEKNECLLQSISCKTATDLSMWIGFWKATCITTLILMALLSLTVWGLTRELARYSAELQNLKEAVTTADGRILSTGNRIYDIVTDHREMTMQNRAIQTEIKGLIGGHIYDVQKHERRERR